MALTRMGFFDEAEKYLNEYQCYIETEKGERFRNFDLCLGFALKGENQKALEHLKIVAQSDIPSYSWIHQLEHSPVFSGMEDMPEFRESVLEIKNKFNAMHDRMEKSLRNEELL